MKTSEQPLVSVAVITFNQKAYLKECLDSILTQDYSRLQIVVADDGSTDGTREMLREYLRAHDSKFVLVLSPENRGITANSNAAQHACVGKYISWMGGDDIMLPGKISAQVAHMESDRGVAISYHDLEVFDSASGKVLYLFGNRFKPRTGVISKLVRHGSFNGACSTMVRASCTPILGFDSRLTVASDWLYFVRTLESGGRIEYLHRVLGRYRRHSSNVTSMSATSAHGIQDNFVACGILLNEHPELWRHVKYRLAQLLQSAGMSYKGPQRRSYLVASFGMQPRLKTLAWALLSYFRLKG